MKALLNFVDAARSFLDLIYRVIAKVTPSSEQNKSTGTYKRPIRP